MGSENQVHEAVACLNFLYNRRFLHHAATQTDHHVWILLFEAVQITEASVYFIVRILADGTGIVNDKVCLLIRCFHISDLL